MRDLNPVSARYLGSDYIEKNPTWDSQDSPWKALRVREILEAHRLEPASIVDVGCGAGGVLSELRKHYPAARLSGYDIAPQAERFWAQPRSQGIDLSVGDFAAASTEPYDVLLGLDVLEHVQDPYAFLTRLNGRARHYVFHFPLDLSAVSVLRESPLLHVRERFGHIHYYTRALALELLRECGYKIVDARYTGAAFSVPQRGWRTRLLQIPRRLVFAVNHDWGVRLLGGETLMVLASAQTA